MQGNKEHELVTDMPYLTMYQNSASSDLRVKGKTRASYREPFSPSIH